MYGQRVRVFYHGMMRQCNGCFGLGHERWQCKEEKKNWKGYIESLRGGEFPDSLFGTWVKPPAQQQQDQGKAPDLRALLNNPEELKKMFDLYAAATSGASNTSQKQQKPDDKKPRGRPKAKKQ